jgi:elongation factor P--beta-lysine ligase
MHFVVIEKDGNQHFLEAAHCDYYSHMFTSLQLALEVAQQIESNTGKSSTLLFQNLDMYRKSIIIYGALSIEAFVNYYSARHKLSYREELRNVKVDTKLKLFVQHKTNKLLSGESVGIIRKLFKLRNDIVHTKAIAIAKNGLSKTEQSIHARLERFDFVTLIIEINNVFAEISQLDNDEEDLQKMLVKIEKK